MDVGRRFIQSGPHCLFLQHSVSYYTLEWL